jgi:hypothetical protein
MPQFKRFLVDRDRSLDMSLQQKGTPDFSPHRAQADLDDADDSTDTSVGNREGLFDRSIVTVFYASLIAAVLAGFIVWMA